MSSYTTLTGAKTVEGSIKNWVNRSDIPSTTILTEAEAWIYSRLRVREMQARETLTFPADGQEVALPSGFLDPISFRPFGFSQPLPFVHEDALDESRDENGVLSSGTPSRWTIIGETAYVDVLPDEDFAGKLLFYKQPTALAATSNETNFLTTRYPALLRYACMARAYEHMKDTQNAGQYLQFAMNAIGEAGSTDDMWRRNQYVPA